MHRSTHIFFLTLVVSLALFDPGYAENKQSIATEFLSVLAKNVATVLSPTLVGELHDGRPNRTTLNATIVLPTVTTITSPKPSETTTESSKLTNLEADTVRSAQTQSEVRPENQGFPFGFDDNNYRYNYPGINSQGLQGRPDFPGGSFGNPAYYNPELYRAYAGQTSPEGNLQRGESVAGVSPVETVGDGQTGRSPDSLDPSSPNLERFRNFERFPFNNQFSGSSGNFPNVPFSSQRQEGRFGQSLINGFNPNLPGNPNFSGNPNYQNSITNNYPRNSFQSLVDPFQQRQQGLRSNNFDFLPSQRFQNSFDNYPRSLQRGPNFPLGFYPGDFIPGLRDPENFVTPSARIDTTKSEETKEKITAKSAKLDNGNVTNSTASSVSVATENPEILSVQGRIRFGRLLLPALEDYSDLRFRPDAFREYLFTPSNDNKNNNSDNKNTTATNDI